MSVDDPAARWAAKWERAAAALAEATTRLTESEKKRLQSSERSQEATLSLMRSIDKQRQLEAALVEARDENVVLKADVEALCHGSAEPPSRVKHHAPSDMTMDELQDMMMGLEERLGKQTALASHWKGEAFRWAQQAESESIADASASIAWAANAAKESSSRDAADEAEAERAPAGEKTPPPVPVAWLQSELRSTMAALEASREREATLVSQLADAKAVGRGGAAAAAPGHSDHHGGSDSAAGLSPLASRDGRAAVAALSKLERTLGVDAAATAAPTAAANLEGWSWLTARLARLTSAVDGQPRAGVKYTPRKSDRRQWQELEPEPEPEPPATHSTHQELGGTASTEVLARSSPAAAAASSSSDRAAASSTRMRMIKYELLQVSKRPFWHHFILELIILPRQARDKHRES
jgi:hypothetical protein